MTNEELFYYLALQSVEGIGPVNGKKLIKYYGGIKELFADIKDQKTTHKGLSKLIFQRIKDPQIFKRAEKELDFIEKYRLKAVGFKDKDYPERLKHCHDGPLLIFQKGNFNVNNKRIISIVGTRLMTNYGRGFLNEFIKDIKRYLPVIVSGLAYGIDIHTHKESLKNNLCTIGVLGHGLDRIYPKSHRNIAEEMLKNGGLITEFTSGTTPERMNFVKRNRIIAGISEATIVVESANKGGSLITAQLASSYYRDVFAVPGRSGDPFSLGCNSLIKSNKAAMITEASDLEYALSWTSEFEEEKKKNGEKIIAITDEEKKVLQHLDSKEKRMLDELVKESGYSVPHLIGLLLQLELKGLVLSLPGKHFMAV